MDNYCCEELPIKIAVINAIRKQPYYGNEKRDYIIEYIYSHDIWYVGDRDGLFQVRSKCAKEYCEMFERIHA